MKRKATFAEIHLALLHGIKWDQVDGVGRRLAGEPDPRHLSVRLPEASLVIEHPDAVTDHVYLAFDGLTAAVVNMADTFGRLVNAVYQLNINPKQASLFAIRDRCTVTSSLGSVLHDLKNIEWLRKVRDMRGRCQHADIEDVLTLDSGPYAQRGQPIVDRAYSWVIPARPTPVLVYAQEAIAAAESCLLAATSAILLSPRNPIA
jgi:hypothetical protein